MVWQGSAFTQASDYLIPYIPEVQIVHNRSPETKNYQSFCFPQEKGRRGGGEEDYELPVNSSEFLVALVSGFSCFQAVYGPSEGYK